MRIARTLATSLLVIGIALLTAATVQASYIDAVLAENPLSYWQLSETNMSNTGTAANSATSGSTYNGTYNGTVTPVLGGIPGAGGAAATVASFGGSGSITASDANLPLGSNSRTLVAWIKTTQMQSAANYANAASYGTDGAFYSDFGVIRDSNKSSMLANSYGGGLSNPTGVNDGNWHMLALTVDSTDSVSPNVVLWRLSVDGNTSSDGYGTTTTALHQMRISGNWKGEISQVAFFGTTLSPEKISTLYTAGITPIPEPNAIVLLASGLIGLLCYAWRRSR